MSIPLAIAGLLIPSPLGRVRDATRRQAAGYEAAMPAQHAHAGASVGVLPEIIARVGSQDWTSQLTGGARLEGPTLPAVNAGNRTRVPWPVGMFRPNLPPQLIEGRGTGYNTGAYPKGWIVVSQAGSPSWGSSAGLAAYRPQPQRDRINPPGAVTPTARAVASDYQTTHAGATRLTDLFGD